MLVRVGVEVDCTLTDQYPDDHFEEIPCAVKDHLQCHFSFQDKVVLGTDASNSIEVPFQIVTHKIQKVTFEHPSDRDDLREVIYSLDGCGLEVVAKDDLEKAFDEMFP